ncbi:hypothetical protein DW082_01535 [Alistipes sp. AF48-12]|nr:hypothetical protein DW082_01535 [Alistipes sp. AF48-12]
MRPFVSIIMQKSAVYCPLKDYKTFCRVILTAGAERHESNRQRLTLPQNGYSSQNKIYKRKSGRRDFWADFCETSGYRNEIGQKELARSEIQKKKLFLSLESKIKCIFALQREF